MNKTWMFLLIAGACLAGIAPPARADVFKSAKECVTGKRVADSGNKTGKITRVEGVMCFVLRDDTGKETSYIFWMLRDQGSSAETDDKLVNGTYECFAGLPNQYTFMDVLITGANTYEAAKTKGTFRVDTSSRKIVFESGSLTKYTAKLMAGPSIGLSTDGGKFYGTVCSIKKK